MGLDSRGFLSSAWWHGRWHLLVACISVVTVAMVIVLLAQPSPALAATTAKHEITADWAGSPTPTNAPYGTTVTAEFHVNTNDATNPAANDPVNNVRATLTVANGVFVSIPPVCATTGVTPPSAITANGTQLLCNLGTIKEGTATVIRARVKSTGAVGSRLSVSGTATSDSATAPAGPAVTPQLSITGSHGMDLVISAPNQNYQQSTAPSRSGGNRQTVIVDYGLSMSAGSIPGPSTYTFTLNVSPTVAGQLTGLQWEGCAPVDDSAQATGIPYSDTTHPNRTNDPSCTISGSGTTYTVTLTGLDYSLQHVPTADSLGTAIPSATNFVASGKLIFSYPTPITASTGVDFTATPSTFTFTDGVTQPETSAANDASDTTLVLPGAFADQWAPTGPGAGRTAWDAAYFAAPGASEGDTFPIPGAGSSTSPGTPVPNNELPVLSNADSTAWTTYTGPGGADLAGECTMFANTADFTATNVDFYGVDGAALSNITSAHIWYRTDAIDTKTETCGEPVGVAGSPWTEATISPVCATRTNYISPVYSDDNCLVTLPAGVTAVKMTWNPAVDKQAHHTLRAWGYVPTTATVGSDSWTVGAFNASYDTSTVFPGGWPALNNYINISGNNTVYATIPGCTYAAPACNTNGQRDAMRIQGANGVITKTTPDTSALPGVPVTYQLTAEADISVSTPPAQTFPVVDTLPTGMSYVAGSATPAPVVTTNGSGQQVLTWTFTGVPANTAQHIIYKAETAPNSAIAPGTVLTNTAEIDVPGDNRPAAARQASASVIVPNSGATTLGKSVEANVLSFYGDSSAWDLVVNSQDPVTNPFTDTIDVLPAKGDTDGTNINGSYTITGVDAPSGATVYYTTAARTSLSEDSRSASNGGTPGSISDNTVGWSTTEPAHPTGIRIIGPALAPGASQNIRIAFSTPAGTDCANPASSENKPGQKIVNTADSIAGHTGLPMLSSATTTIGDCYALDLKKYVLEKDGDPATTPGSQNSDWQDANSPADYQQYSAGDTIHYAIVVTNVGTGTLTNIPVMDDHYSACTFTIASLAPGATASHQCIATATVGTTVNTASASVTPPCAGSTCPPQITVNDPAGVLVPQAPHVVKTSSSASGAAVSPRQKIQYTITVTEPADSVAPYLSPSLTDSLAGVTDDATYNNDAVATTASGAAGTVSVDSAAHVLTWTAPLLTPGQVVTITYSVTVNSPLTGDGILTNTVTMPHTNCDPASSDPADCIVTHEVQSFIVTKVADKTTVQPGETITYTITAHNNGQVAYTSAAPASFTDDLSKVLDDATYNNDAKASDGSTVDYSTPTLSWRGALAVSATTTFTYTVTVNTPDTGDKQLRNSVVGGSNCAADSTDPDCTVAIPGPALQLKKTVDLSYADFGQKVHYTIVATNVGAGDYTTADPAAFTDDLTKVLDDASYDQDAKTSSGTLSYGKPTLSWHGALASRASVTITYTVTVHSPDDGNLSMDNTVTTPTGVSSNCGTGSTDPACRTHTPIAAYHVAKSVDASTVKLGDVLHYTIKVSNVGAVAYTSAHPASLIDNMTKVLDDADYNGDVKATSGALNYAEPDLSWTGALPIGTTVRITYTMTVHKHDTGDGALINIVTTPTDPDGASQANCPTGSTDPVCATRTTLPGAGLASTGSNLTPPIALGTLLLGLGALLMTARLRKRRRTT
ncbi:isopeptide-forming domain-containing fimbrial protein [Humibacter sp. RRB41]|uniref:isopeptide-forming domain-containing fimbrial protein n=1 Tax=Humibacter sp. RRB41 TaxID=2919946 RepID=UPI001FAA6849|nr:isopeptide-forming domain-containing fimbrial protein [Humibacter sp. RRB41]